MMTAFSIALLCAGCSTLDLTGFDAVLAGSLYSIQCYCWKLKHQSLGTADRPDLAWGQRGPRLDGCASEKKTKQEKTKHTSVKPYNITVEMSDWLTRDVKGEEMLKIEVTAHFGLMSLWVLARSHPCLIMTRKKKKTTEVHLASDRLWLHEASVCISPRSAVCNTWRYIRHTQREGCYSY